MRVKLYIVIVVIIVGFFVSYNGLKTKVEVEPVTRGLAVDAVSANVTVLSSRENMEISLENGRVVESLFIPGSGAIEVTEGDIICRLDTEMLDFAIEKTRNQLDAATKRLAVGSAWELELGNAQQDYEHSKKLNEIDQFPSSELLKQERNLERLDRLVRTDAIDRKANLRHQEVHLAELQFRKERMTIRASFSGLMTEAYAYPGNYIYAGNSVAKIISKEKIIQLSISEEDFPGIQLDQDVVIRFLGIKGTSFHGKITNLVATANSQTKRRMVYVSLEDVDNNILVSGMTGEASITKASREDALIVPRRAVLGGHVFLVKGSKIKIQEVSLGFRGLYKVEILAGLEEGDLLVVENLDDLRDGDRVSILK